MNRKCPVCSKNLEEVYNTIYNIEPTPPTSPIIKRSLTQESNTLNPPTEFNTNQEHAFPFSAYNNVYQLNFFEDAGQTTYRYDNTDGDNDSNISNDNSSDNNGYIKQ